MSPLDTVSVVTPVDTDLFVGGQPTVLRTPPPYPLYAPDPDEEERGVYDEVTVESYRPHAEEFLVRTVFGITMAVKKKALRMGVAPGTTGTDTVRVMGSAGTRVTVVAFVSGADEELARKVLSASLRNGFTGPQRRIELWELETALEPARTWDLYSGPPSGLASADQLVPLALDVPDSRAARLCALQPPGRRIYKYPRGQMHAPRPEPA